MRVALVNRAIDIAALIAEVSDASCGGVSVFLGAVRNLNEGRDVTGIDYSAYESMAEREMTAIAREADERFGVNRVVIEHRLGHLGLGDVSIAIVAAHAHRAAALDTTRFVIEQVKQRVPIWKREHYVDGTREWVGAGTGNRRPCRCWRGARRMTATLKDQFGRSIEYLRISVTDRCNFRCLYCMPAEGLPWLPKAEILTYEEIADVVRQLAPLGLRRLRITGGEPTIRPDLEQLIRMLRAVPEIEDIALSTNGARMLELAPRLRDAGLDRMNMSADSLRPDRIAAIARRKIAFEPVSAALAAESAGIGPIKINVVVMRGINDDEVEDFARLTLEHPWHVRFIELMPVGEMSGLTWEHIVPSDEVLSRIASLGALTSDMGPPRGNGPAKYYRLAGAEGTIGVITPMTHTYCASCNRVRLTADGRLRTCLFGDHEVLLRDALRQGELLEPLFRQALADKPKEHALLQMKVGGLRALSQVGG